MERLSFLFLISFFLSHTSFGATIYVPADFGTITEAVEMAADGDTILVGPGNYEENNIELLGKNLSIIAEAGPEQTTIDAGEQGQFGFHIHEGEELSALVSGFRIIGATAAGISLNGGSAMIRNCVIENNNSGIFLQSTDAVIERCTIRNNAPGSFIYGGGISSRSITSDAIVRNCLIADNHSDSDGGGISIFNSPSPAYVNCTIAGNTSASKGGGIYAYGGWPINLRNCIVWGNQAAEHPNLSAYNFDITYSNIEGICVPSKGNISQDPEFIDDAYHLSLSSPCIDAGSPADGLEPDNTQVNMGAYGNADEATAGNAARPIIESLNPESGPPAGEQIIITGQRFGNAGSVWIGGIAAVADNWTDSQIICTAPAHASGPVTIEVINEQTLSSRLTFGYLYEGQAVLRVPSEFVTIQEAIYCAADGDTILIAPGTYTGNGNRNLELLGKEVLIVSEAGAEETTIDVDGQAPYGFNVHQGEGLGGMIRGFRIINATQAGAAFDGGSAIVQDCIVENNNSGIFLQSTDAVIEGCTIRNNAPGSFIYGGGISSRSSSDDAIVRNCLITDNFSVSDGGGISVVNSNSPTYINCTIIGNVSNGMGGGAFAFNGWGLRMRNCIVWANEASQHPGLSVEEGDITYSDIQGGWPGIGNLEVDPCFANVYADDYHLNPASTLIDAGDPSDDFSLEPAPNGGRINMGRYGNTAEAASYEALAVIGDFFYELGCDPTTLVSLTGKNFGSIQGSGQILLGANEIDATSLWTDTLIQFTANADLIEDNDIILITDQGLSDTIPAEYTYTPFAQYVSGEVSGVWTTDCPGTYILTGSVTVPAGASLTIEPGVKVLVDKRFAGSQAIFRVEGTLIANGALDDPVLFSVIPFQANPGSWEGLDLDMQGSSEAGNLSHCIIEYARTGLVGRSSNITIDSCLIRNNSENGIRWLALEKTALGQVSHSQIRDNGGYGIRISAFGGGGGNANASPDILRNLIEQNQAGGIQIEARASTPFSGLVSRSANANPRIAHNIIRDNEGLGIDCFARGDWADGIPFDFFYRAFTNPTVEGNLITNNRGAFQAVTNPTGGGTWLSFSEPDIVNCTIAGNGETALMAGDSSVVSVSNCIVIGSGQSVEEVGGGRLMAYNSTLIPVFSGTDMVDIPPMFFDAMSGDYRLLAQSAQIDAGDNSVVSETEDLLGNERILDSNDDGMPIVDIGAIEYALPRIIDQTGDKDICEGQSLTLEVEASGQGLQYQWEKDGTPVNGAINSVFEIVAVSTADQGSYTCVISDELGGQAVSEMIMVTVLNLETVTIEIEASHNEICQGDTVVFTAVPVNGGNAPVFDWLLNGETTGNNEPVWTFDNFQDGDEVTCNLQSSALCVENSTTTSEAIVLTVYDLPVVVFDFRDTICIEEGDIPLSGGAPEGGVYSGELVEDLTFLTTQAPPGTTYVITYRYTDEFGCTTETQQSLFVDVCTHTSGITRDFRVELFPNPAGQHLQIRTHGFLPKSIRIYTASGKLYQQTDESRLSPEMTMIDCNYFPEGLYFIRISDGTYEIFEKFIRQ